ncbi:MAG: DUF5658 family protein [archaeon]
MKVFMFFVFVTIVDAVFTIIGIRNGAITEANVIIRFVDENTALDIYQSIIVFKLMAVLGAYWFVTVLPFSLQRIKDRLSFPILAEQKVCENILLVITLATYLFGAIPSLSFHLHYTIFGVG